LPSSDSDEEMDEEEEKKMNLKHQDLARKTTKKGGISAEAYGEYHTLNDFVPKVIEKSEEQKKQIVETLKKSFMFNNLEGKALEIVIDAMEI
jgi:cAMP-dependent protein kinase regulator